MQPNLDAVMVGRSSVDLYPLQVATALEDVTSFGKFVGGSPTNVSIAARRLGTRTGIVTGVGADPFGRYLIRELTETFGVDASGVVTLDGVKTSLAFCEIYPPDDFPLYFYREAPAPELRLGPEDIDPAAITSARMLWLSVSGLSTPPSRAMHHAALDLRPGRLNVLDLDYRPMFWASAEEAGRHVRDALGKVSVAVGNKEECLVATGESDPDRAADALLEAGVQIAIVKRGPEGVLGKTAHERVEVAPTPTEVVNGLGAGDAFGGSLAHGLLNDHGLEQTLREANAAGAIVAARLECSSAMPTAEEIAQVLALGRVPTELTRPPR